MSTRFALSKDATQKVQQHSSSVFDGIDDEKKSEPVNSQDLVIPLIAVNQWRTDEAMPAVMTTTKRERSRLDQVFIAPTRTQNVLQPSQYGLQKGSFSKAVEMPSSDPVEKEVKQEDLEDLARQQLEGAGKRYRETGESLLSNASSSLVILPAHVQMHQNRPPHVENLSADDPERVKRDVAVRPTDEPAYDRVPVAAFGAAMLRGMGWRDGEAIGRDPARGLVTPIAFAKRPHLAGIGAQIPTALDANRPGPVRDASGKVKHVLTLDEQEEAVKRLKSMKKVTDAGAKVLLLSEKYKNLTGRVVRLDRDGVLVRLDLSGVEVVSSDKELSILDEKAVALPERDSEIESSKPKVDSWLYHGLIVRIISRSFAQGRFYLLKGSIIDVLDGGASATVLINHQNKQELVSAVPLSCLESVIPSVGGLVRVHCNIDKRRVRHRLARVLSRDNKKQTVLVQWLVEDDDEVDEDDAGGTFHFDHVCETTK